MKLLAVDGNSVLNRAYYGIRLLSTRDGVFTNGIYGFLSILLRLRQEVRPDAVAVAFDLRAPTFRHKMYDGYKAQRKGMPDELARQMPLLRELLGHLGYAIVDREGYEADDLLGTLARACCESGNECVIATGDRDSFQLISGCVTVRLAYTKGGTAHAELYDEAAIREKYGVEPIQLIDVKALMGDSSDNVPGVAGIGEKGALTLIQRFGGLDSLYASLEDPAVKPGIRAKLEAGRESAYLSRDLVTIDCQVPIDAEIGHYVPRGPDHGEAYALMARLELFSLIEKFGIEPGGGSAGTPGEEQAVPALSAAFNAELPDGALDEGKTADVLFDFDGAELKALCVILEGALYFRDADTDRAAREILTSAAQKRTGDVKTLYHYAIRQGFECRNLVFDAGIAGYILNPSANSYAIPRLAGEYGVAPVPLDGILDAHAALMEECAVFSKLADLLTEQLRENLQIKLFREVELPLARVLADMEHTGFEADAAGLAAYGETLEEEIARCQGRIHELAEEPFNINSPKQLGVVLFEKLGLPAGKKTKTGYSTDADTLEFLRDKHEIVERILRYRTLTKLKSTYVDGLMAQIGPDGRIHTTFRQTLTRTGRISSTEPNLQNIPIRTELGSELRRFFRAQEGCVLVDADYSQIELRVLAHIAEDVNMIAAFRDEEDIHLNTAAQVFGLPRELVTSLMRSRAKAVNFGIVYGMGAYSLSRDIGVSVSEADRYIKSYLETYSGVRKYMADIIEFAAEHGFVATLLNRRRGMPELASSNRPAKEAGKRVAMNTPIQGTAADIIKIAMVRVHRRLREEEPDARLILQVHDELIVECPHDRAEQVSALVREEMEGAMSLSVPLKADVHIGDNWLEAK